MMKKLMALIMLGVFAFSMIPANASARNIVPYGVSVKDRPFLVGAENYSKAKVTDQDLARNWDTARKDWLSVKDTLGRVEKPVDRTVFVDKLKKFLTLTIDRIIIRLQLLSHWVDRIIKDEDRKEKMFSIIEDDINELEDLKTSVENAETVGELRDLGKKIKEKWIEDKLHIKRMVVKILSTRLGGVIDRLELVSDRLHKRLDELVVNEINGEMIAQLRELLDQFDEQLGLARQDYELYLQERSTDTLISSSQDVLKARQHLREAIGHLREAHKILKDFMNLYREFIQSTEKAGVSKQPLYLDLKNGGSQPAESDV